MCVCVLQLGLLLCGQSPLHTHMHTHALRHTNTVHFPSVIPVVPASSSHDITVDSIIGKPLLVAPSLGGQVTLFAVVTAAPCPSIQWRFNRSAVSNGGNYTIGNPCSNSPAGTTVFNFTLTITATAVTTGTYSATLTNLAGAANLPDVFVTPPGTLALKSTATGLEFIDACYSL